MESVVYQIVYIIANIFSMFIIYKFMSIFFDKVKTNKLLLIGSYIFYFVLTSAEYLFINIPIVTLLCNIISLVLITLNYESSYKKKLLAVSFTYVFMFVMEIFVVIITVEFSISPIEQGSYVKVGDFVVIKIITFVAAILASNFKNMKNNKPVSRIFWVSAFLVPLLTLYLELLILGADNLSQISAVISVVCILAINVLTFYLYDAVSAYFSNKMETELFNKEKEYYFNQFEMMKKSSEELYAFRHEVKNYLSVVEDMFDTDKSTEKKDYLKQLAEKIKQNDLYSNSGNAAIDSIINCKLKEASNNGVDVAVDVSVPEALSIDAIDIVTILGNIIDNAYEATIKLVNNRKINLKIEFSKGILFLNLRNTFSGEIKYDEEENTIVSKKESDLHGYGLKNIKKTIEKYNGCMEISEKEKLFNIDILLYTQSI